MSLKWTKTIVILLEELLENKRTSRDCESSTVVRALVYDTVGVGFKSRPGVQTPLSPCIYKFTAGDYFMMVFWLLIFVLRRYAWVKELLPLEFKPRTSCVQGQSQSIGTLKAGQSSSIRERVSFHPSCLTYTYYDQNLLKRSTWIRALTIPPSLLTVIVSRLVRENLPSAGNTPKVGDCPPNVTSDGLTYCVKSITCFKLTSDIPWSERTNRFIRSLSWYISSWSRRYLNVSSQRLICSFNFSWTGPYLGMGGERM